MLKDMKSDIVNAFSFNVDFWHCECIFFSRWLLSKIFNKLNEKYQVPIENEKEKEDCN